MGCTTMTKREGLRYSTVTCVVTKSWVLVSCRERPLKAKKNGGGTKSKIPTATQRSYHPQIAYRIAWFLVSPQSYLALVWDYRN